MRYKTFDGCDTEIYHENIYVTFIIYLNKTSYVEYYKEYNLSWCRIMKKVIRLKLSRNSTSYHLSKYSRESVLFFTHYLCYGYGEHSISVDYLICIKNELE